MKQASQLHWPSLDGLRGLAILMVILHNTELLDGVRLAFPDRAVEYVFDAGWIGVILFFALSGFLITGILLDTADLPHAFRNFVVRRALRIFPLYYGMLVLIFWVLPAFHAQPALYAAEVPHQIWLWTYLYNWTGVLYKGPDSLPHFWSLSVEEQFYLVWPLLVLGLKRPVRVAWACLIVATVSVVCRDLFYRQGVPPDVIYSWSITRVDALAFGGLAAAFLRHAPAAAWLKQHRQGAAWTLLAVFVLSAVVTHNFPRTTLLGMVLGYTVIAVTCAGIILASTRLDAIARQAHEPSGSSPASPPAMPFWHRCLTWRPLQSVGKYSYGMYVFHKPLHENFSRLVLSKLGWQPAGHLLVAVLHLGLLTVITYGLAWLSYHLYEVHFLRLKRYFT